MCAIFLFISTSVIFAQQSIGFSDPDDIQPLLDYRLPDWGYSNFHLDFNAAGSGIDQNSSSFKQVQKFGNLNLGPAYTLYRESEARIFQLNAFTDFAYSSSFNSNDFFGDSESSDNTLKIDFNVFANLKEYVTERSFVYGKTAARIDYNSSKSEFRDDGTLTDKTLIYDRIVSINPAWDMESGVSVT